MSEMVRICPYCGHENPRNSPFCAKCPGNLSSVRPVLKAVTAPTRAAEPPPCGSASQPAALTFKAAPAADVCRLELAADPSQQFTITPGQSVGRSDAADVVLDGVPKGEWISRRHAEFLRHGEQWYVRHVGGTNHITVNGTQHDDGTEVAIYDGDILALTYTEFVVRLGGG